jgi:hypothetical protein
MLVIPHRFKKIGLQNLVVRRIFSDTVLILGLKRFRNTGLENMGASTSHNPIGLHGLLQGELYLYLW